MGSPKWSEMAERRLVSGRRLKNARVDSGGGSGRRATRVVLEGWQDLVWGGGSKKKAFGAVNKGRLCVQTHPKQTDDAVHLSFIWTLFGSSLNLNNNNKYKIYCYFCMYMGIIDVWNWCEFDLSIIFGSSVRYIFGIDFKYYIILFYCWKLIVWGE